MPKYLMQASYTGQGLQGLAKDGARKRRDAVQKATEQIGGKLEIWSGARTGTEIAISIPGSTAYRTSVARPLFSLLSLFGRKAG